jgi:hypothetical protein
MIASMMCGSQNSDLGRTMVFGCDSMHCWTWNACCFSTRRLCFAASIVSSNLNGPVDSSAVGSVRMARIFAIIVISLKVASVVVIGSGRNACILFGQCWFGVDQLIVDVPTVALAAPNALMSRSL